MTNRDALILSLRMMGPDEEDAEKAFYESPWEDYAPAESNVAYWIECPRCAGEPNLPCEDLEAPFSTLSVCGPCKEAWLDEEISE